MLRVGILTLVVALAAAAAVTAAAATDVPDEVQCEPTSSTCFGFGKSSSSNRDKDAFSPKPIELPWHRLLDVYARPYHYELNLDFSSRSASNWSSYRGAVNISVEFKGPDGTRLTRCMKLIKEKIKHPNKGNLWRDDCFHRAEKKNQIVLHADKSINIKSVRVFKFAGDAGKSSGLKQLKIAKQGRDEAKQLISLEMASDLPRAGSKGLIEFVFEADMREDEHGIYKSEVWGAGCGQFFPCQSVTAKFQPTFARLALPCFDEPSFKAKFSMSFTHPASLDAYANTELLESTLVGTNRVSKFKETPVMPIHMLAFTIGDYDEPLELQVRDNLRLRAITMPGKRQEGAYALEVAKFALEQTEKYLDFKYPLEKLDIVAIPETDTDNTETWGLVFVRDHLALVDDETKPESKIPKAVNVLHVVVHQWFANLITAAWWDDLWITEGVASQMAFELAADLFPGQSNYLARITTLSSILESDIKGEKHALSPESYELATSDQVYELFDNLQFMKSGSLARLLQNRLGNADYRALLQKLVRKHAYKNLDIFDLILAIEGMPKAPKYSTLGQMLVSWTKLRGYPVINVAFNADHTKLFLYEEPRSLATRTLRVDGTNDDEKTLPPSPWTITLKLHFSDFMGNNQVTQDVTLGGLSQSSSAIDLPAWFVVGRDWVKVSPGADLSTYYRVRYSEQALMALRRPILDGLIAPEDRLHLLNDFRSLAYKRLIEPKTFEDILGWFIREKSGSMLIEMALAAHTLTIVMYKDEQPLRTTFLNFFKEHGFKVSGDETLLEQRARALVYRDLMSKDEKAVIKAGVKAYEESEGGNVPLFLREPVYAAVVKAGTAEQVDELLSKLKRTKSREEQLRLANALAYSRNEAVSDAIGLWLQESDLDEETGKSILLALNMSRALIAMDNYDQSESREQVEKS